MIKKGFSLAELLVSLMIVGILTTITLTTLKPTEKALKIAYSSAYDGLSTSFYNLMIQRDFSADDGDPFAENLKGDGTNSDKILCNLLIDQINFISRPSCDAASTGDLADSFPEANIKFTSTNGYRFYISQIQSAEYEFGGDAHTTYYYLVFVDINGSKRPNSLAGASPDIFAFALLDTGMTVPLGLPEYDTRYLSAKLAHYNEQSEIIYAEPSMPYYLAKNAAWGCYEGREDKELTDDERELKAVFYNPEVPFTMNEVIRDSLSENSNIKIDLPQAENELRSVDNGTPQCNRYDYDNCFVVIDRYTY